MNFVRGYFDTNENLTSWTLLAHFFSKSVLIPFYFSSDLEKNKPKVCNWSEFHLNRSYFLQNPYFKRPGWRLNHSFYRKFGFNEFVANILRDNMGSKKISLQTKKQIRTLELFDIQRFNLLFWGWHENFRPSWEISKSRLKK